MDNGDLISLLGSLVTAYVAINIFGKWKEQKGSEVVANESRELIKDLLLLVQILGYLKSNKYEENEIINKCKEFMEVNTDIVKKNLYLKSIINDTKLEKSVSEYNNKNIEIRDLIEESISKNQLVKIKESLFKEYGDKAFYLVNILKPYTIYRKDIKFKKDKPKSA